MQPLQKFIVTSGAALLVVTTVAAGAAHAEAAPVSERYAARAGSQVAEVSLFGRRVAFGSATADSDLDAVGGQLQASATGLGSTLVHSASKSTARFNDGAAPAGSKCASPALAPALDKAAAANPDLALPTASLSSVCGAASVSGDAKAFSAASSGGRTQLAIKLNQALGSHIQDLVGTLDRNILETPVGELVAPAAAPQAKAAVAAVNGLLGSIVPGVALDQVEPKQTVSSLMERLQAGDLVRIEFSGASARNAGDAGVFVSEALSQGGAIDVLPELRGPNSAPLLRITVADSRAGVTVERKATQAVPTVKNTIVRIEGELLSKLPLAGPSVVDGLVGGVPLSTVQAAKLPVVDGLLGGGLPFDQLTAGLGLRSGSDHVEVGPGQGISVLCAGAVAPLCSEISVEAPTTPATLPSGLTRAQTSKVTAHLFKGLDHLRPGLGGVLADPRVTSVVDPLAAPAGLTLGEATGLSGIRLVMAGAVAEAGGTRVMGAEAVQTVEPHSPVTESPAPLATPSLPHTGGLPFNTDLVPVLFGAAVGLQVLCRKARPKG